MVKLNCCYGGGGDGGGCRGNRFGKGLWLAFGKLIL